MQSQCNGQSWINELNDFNFTVHYKPGVEDVVADTLSWLPVNNVEDLQTFSGLCSVDKVKAIFDVQRTRHRMVRHGYQK